MKANLERGSKKLINGWAMYDWANSVYSLVITTAIFPIYYLALTNGPDEKSQPISFFGLMVDNVSLLSYALSAAFLIIAVISPLLSGIADYSGRKKLFMQIFCYIGSASCAALYFFDSLANTELGIIAYGVAAIGFTGSIVFYNAYLPEVAFPHQQDRVSAKGFALGYIGSVLLLLVNLAMVMKPALFGLPEGGLPARISFLMVGLWWFGFAQITFSRLPSNVYKKKATGNYLFQGYRELLGVLRHMIRDRVLQPFLISFFFFSMGVQTIMYLAVLFAQEEIGMKDDMLIIVMLIIQIVAIAGAYLFSWFSARLGNLKALLISMVMWIVVVVAVFFIYQQTPFIMIAFVVGLIMGGTQSLTRSTYSKLLPETTDHASYFSFYDVTEKISIVVGTLTFGLMNDWTGSLRGTLWPLLGFFVIALAVLLVLHLRGNRERLKAVAPLVFPRKLVKNYVIDSLNLEDDA